MSRCVIISACPVSASLASALRPGDTIIACDAGYRNCAPLHCRPDIIVGDFDTAPCPAQEGDDTIILPHVKDDTDTEYAAKLASEKGFDEALLLGVLGGRRLEHTLANLCTGLGLEQRGVRATLLDERSRITFVMPGETRRYPKDGYFYLSVFPLTIRFGQMHTQIGLAKKLGKEDIYTKITKWNTKTGLSNGPETNLYNLARHENLYINNKNVVIK